MDNTRHIAFSRYRKLLAFAISVALFVAFGRALVAQGSSVSTVYIFAGLTLSCGYFFASGFQRTRNSVRKTCVAILAGATFALTLHALSVLPKVNSAILLPISWAKIDWLAWLLIALAAPLFEETLIRGYLYDFLRWIGVPVLAIAIAFGILFAATHNNVSGHWSRWIFFFSLSFLLTVARARCGGLAWPIACHFVWNAGGGLLFGSQLVTGLEFGWIKTSGSAVFDYLLLSTACLGMAAFFLYQLKHKPPDSGVIPSTRDLRGKRLDSI